MRADIKLWLTHALIIAVAVLTWETFPKIGIVSKIILPPFSDVLKNLLNILITGTTVVGDLSSNFIATLYEIVVAYLIATSIGIGIGFIIGSVRTIADVFEPIIYAFYAIPSVILYPIIFLILGIGENSKVAFGVLLGFLPIVASTVSGIMQLNPDYFKVAISMGATKIQLLTKVLFPGSMPVLMSGLRLGLAYTIIGVIVGEMLASSRGLGYLIYSSSFLLEIPTYFAIAIIAILLSLIVTSILNVYEEKATKYRMVRGR